MVPSWIGLGLDWLENESFGMEAMVKEINNSVNFYLEILKSWNLEP
jgi:hypothetical protein